MSPRRALIVDDSKSARVVLSRMLEQHNLDVDMAESAEQALEYLAMHRPDVIFMDHLMPGMDGFQAVQAIKNNPRTATIPIMMYTSQEGDLYVGQARALGASGVLPKQLKPVDVSKVLYQLNLMPDRHEAEIPRVAAETRAPSVVVMADSAAAQAASQYASGYGKAEPPTMRPAGGELRAQIESLIREQTTELRRFVIASLDSYASRVVSDLRAAPVDEVIIENGDELPPPPPRHTARNFAIAAGAMALVLGAGLLWFGLELKGLGTQNATLKAQLAALEQSNRQLTNQVGAMTSVTEFDGTSSAGANRTPAGAVTPQLASGTAAISAPTALIEAIPYGEIPLAATRVETVRSMLSQLAAQGFEGTLRIEIFPGRFCLAGNATDGYSQAPDELAYSKCDLVGNPAFDNMAAAQRQSLAFVNMIADMERASGGRIRVNIASGSADRPATPYPNAAAEGMTAGQWNHAASANNRIEISAVADS